ncbi:hypothetical protein PG993_007315 [Apiospora rasikravindrae]|uniref:Uncharacterized protein n=1 Tax=Apiospora rasikravindrae TaxID=990691 RepID=A0ABR1SX57_9PEZI
MPERKKSPEKKKLPEKTKKGDPAVPDVPPSASSKPGHWKDKIERKSRAIDKELGFDEVTAENADEWLNARMNRISQESQQRSEASWVQLQAGLDFQQKMSRGLLPGTKEPPPPPPPINNFEPRTTRLQKATLATLVAEAQRKMTPEPEDKDEPPALFGPLPQISPSEEKLHQKRRLSLGPSPSAKRRPSMRSPPPPEAKGDEMLPPPKQEDDDYKPATDDTDIQSVRGHRRQPRTQRRHSPPQRQTEFLSEHGDSHDQHAQSRRRPRANPLDTNLGPNWDFHMVDGSRPTKARGSGYTT